MKYNYFDNLPAIKLPKQATTINQKVWHYIPETVPEKLFIDKIWKTCGASDVARLETVLPKGTVEIVFNFSDGVSFRKFGEHTSYSLPSVFVNGLNFSPVHVSLPKGQHYFGLQLHPCALPCLFDLTLEECNNQILGKDVICKSLNLLAEQLSETHPFMMQVNLVLNWLDKKLSECNLDVDIYRRILSLHLNQNIIHLSVRKLGEDYSLSERHLRRLCRHFLGLSPEKLILYKKYLAALKRLHLSEQKLTAVGLECGFYDQSHFIRTFRLFTGMTPGNYIAKKGIIPGHIFEIPR